jgi:Glycosyl transferase family 2
MATAGISKICFDYRPRGNATPARNQVILPLPGAARIMLIRKDNVENSRNAPAVSVVIVSDYGAGSEVAWAGMRATLAAMAAQDFAEPAEFILCESEKFRASLPVDVSAALPALKTLFVRGNSAYDLKNAAVVAASGEIVVFVDADCVPRPDCLRRLVASLRNHPEAAAVSGKTIYPGDALSVRISSLLSRAYIDPGGAGPTKFISENCVAYRRAAYLAHPMPTHMGTFAAHVQAEKLRACGAVLWFDPKIQVEHDFEGWTMERDFRRNRGHGTIQTRLLDRSLPYSWLVRLGRIGIAPIIAWKILSGWRECLRCGRGYGIRWYEVPVAMAASVRNCLFEVPGMLAAFRGEGRGSSNFR